MLLQTADEKEYEENSDRKYSFLVNREEFTERKKQINSIKKSVYFQGGDFDY